jgi:chorismate mutase
MTEEEYKSYRFSSGEDPTDEMLDQLMTNAANRVRKENEEANRRFFEELHRECKAVEKRMKERQINS